MAGENREGVRCQHPSCERPAKRGNLGWCGLHYQRQHAGRDMDAPLRTQRAFRPADGKCAHPPCEEPYAKPQNGVMYCSMHAGRKADGRDMDVPRFWRRRKAPADGLCTYPECDRPHRSRGYCYMHYHRAKQGLDMGAPVIWPKAPVGTVRRTADGYLREQTADRGWVKQHRLVMERQIGRQLERHEIVHHRNGVRHHNRLSNLELCIRRQPPGQRVVDQVAWARDIIAEYGELAERLS